MPDDQTTIETELSCRSQAMQAVMERGNSAEAALIAMGEGAEVGIAGLRICQFENGQFGVSIDGPGLHGPKALLQMAGLLFGAGVLALGAQADEAVF